MFFSDQTDLKQTPAAWDRAIDFLRRSGDHAHEPLLTAAKAGLINLGVICKRNEALPFGRIRRSQRPVLLLVNDDDETPTGPAGWSCARQVTRWCHGAIVHGACAERKHYDSAVMATLVCQKFLMIDTASRWVPAWAEMLGHVQVLGIMPRDGQHPIDMPSVVH